MFFRPDLESTLQPLNSSSRKRLSRRRREVSGHVEDQAKLPTGLGHEATLHGWRSAQSTSARRRRAGLCSRFPGFQSAVWANSRRPSRDTAAEPKILSQTLRKSFSVGLGSGVTNEPDSAS